jgi:hypothetical protein
LRALRLTPRTEAAPDETEPDIPARYARRMRPSASTIAMAAGGVPFRTFSDARQGQALTHDVGGASARARGFDVPHRPPEDAARVLWSVSAGHDFTLFEHFQADEAGHAQHFDEALAALGAFDAFARAVIATRPDDACVLICSDHGNVEDLSTRGHTLNRVAFLQFGGPFDSARGEAGSVCGHTGATFTPSEVEGRAALENVADVGRWVLAALGVSR